MSLILFTSSATAFLRKVMYMKVRKSLRYDKHQQKSYKLNTRPKKGCLDSKLTWILINFSTFGPISGDVMLTI